MRTSMPSPKVRLLVQDAAKLYRVGKIATIDAGCGLLIVTADPLRKQSIHSDGKHWDRLIPAEHPSKPTASPPPSLTTFATITTVDIPSDLTYRSSPFTGTARNALVIQAADLAV